MKVVLQQTSIGDYRQKVLELLIQHWGDDFHVLAGPCYFEPSLKTRIDIGTHFSWASNHFLLRRRLLFQTGVWRQVIGAEVAIMEMNPRIISNWIIILIRKLLRRKTVLWGHAWPRSGPNSKSDRLRHLMRTTGDAIITYTETQATELRKKMPNKKVVAAPNALYSSDDMGAATSPDGVTDFIYVGRLIDLKKPHQLLLALAKALDKMPGFGRLLVVGDGPERSKLIEQAEQLGISERVHFPGHVADIEKLRAYYSRSLFSFSPGYVGLSITQSFAFGVPMVISRTEIHAPEIEAAVEGSNSVFFKTDSVDDLAQVMQDVWKDRDSWITRRDEIAADCSTRYSAELMARRIIESTQ